MDDFMQCRWVLLDDELPAKQGTYLVVWSNPYCEKTWIQSAFFNGVMKRFDESPAGANEILYWLDGVDEIPDLPREGIRTRLVKR